MVNVYAAARKETGEEAVVAFSGATHAYTVPGLSEGGPHSPTGDGWASPLPDDSARSHRIPVMQYRPEDNASPESFWNPLDRDKEGRHSVENQDADGFGTTMELRAIATDPRRAPVPELCRYRKVHTI